MSTALSRAFQAMNTRSIVSGEQCGLCVSIGLEGNKVIGAILHQRQPVYYKLVGLAPGEAKLGKGILQESGGIPSGHAISLGKIVTGIVDALPVEIVIYLSGTVHQGAVRIGSDGPAAAIGWISAGQFTVIVKLYRDVCFLLGV
jgi:hypothetical protein